MVPIAYGGSAMAYQAGVQNAHASPLTTEILSVMSLEGADQFVLVQNGEPGGLYCPDETDGETLRVCEQITERCWPTRSAARVGPVARRELGVQRGLHGVDVPPARGVTFHDGSEFDAVDVVESYKVQWDAADPRHVGRTGDFQYWGGLFGGSVRRLPAVICGFLNPPAAAEE